VKIHTETFAFELSIDEFEEILERDLLDTMVSVVATLSEKVEEGDVDTVDEILMLLNEILDNGAEGCMEGLYGYNDDFENEEGYDGEEDSNVIVNEIYDIIFGNGETNYGR